MLLRIFFSVDVVTVTYAASAAHYGYNKDTSFFNSSKHDYKAI